jgi:hypothetical protein
MSLRLQSVILIASEESRRTQRMFAVNEILRLRAQDDFLSTSRHPE